MAASSLSLIKNEFLRSFCKHLAESQEQSAAVRSTLQMLDDIRTLHSAISQLPPEIQSAYDDERESSRFTDLSARISSLEQQISLIKSTRL